MNLTNLARLKDAILTGDGRPEIGFNMHAFNPIPIEGCSGRGCETACCMAGWAQLLMDPEGAADTTSLKEFLEISFPAAECLALGIGLRKELQDISATEAIRVLELLEETGAVDWAQASADCAAKAA